MRQKIERFKRWLLEDYPGVRATLRVPLFDLIQFISVILFLSIMTGVIKRTLPEDDPARWAITFIIGLVQWYCIWWYTVENWRVGFRLFRLALFVILLFNIILDLTRLP